jgi:hypothetical protein
VSVDFSALRTTEQVSLNPKIINVSLPRTATQSFHSFALAKAFSSKHFLSPDENKELQNLDRQTAANKYLEIIKDFESISDTPVCLFLDEIIKNNRGATYVLIKRSPESWAESVITSMEIEKKMVNLWPNYWAALLFDQYLDIDYAKGYVSKNELISIYNKYHENLNRIFKQYEIDPIRLSLENELSIDLNKIFDKIRKTDFVKLPNVDVWKQ